MEVGEDVKVGVKMEVEATTIPTWSSKDLASYYLRTPVLDI